MGVHSQLIRELLNPLLPKSSLAAVRFSSGTDWKRDFKISL